MSIIKWMFEKNEAKERRNLRGVCLTVLFITGVVVIAVPELFRIVALVLLLCTLYESMYWFSRGMWAAVYFIVAMTFAVVLFFPRLAWEYRAEIGTGIKDGFSWFVSLFSPSATTKGMREARKKYRDEVKNIKSLRLPAAEHKAALAQAYLRFMRRVEQILA